MSMQNPVFLFAALSLASAVALLIWSVNMVRTGVDRGFSHQLRTLFGHCEKNRLLGGLIGVVTAIIMQGSTAVTLLVSGFLADRKLTALAGLAIVLGADLGAAIAVGIFSFDLTWLIPFLVLIGVFLSLKSSARQGRLIGRILLGVGFLLIALRLIGEATIPLRGGSAFVSLTEYLESDLLTAFLLGMLLTWAIHSSIAAILLISLVFSTEAVSQPLAVALVLGVNAGGALIAFMLTRAASPEVRLLPTANLMLRSLLGLVILGIVFFRPEATSLGDPYFSPITFHLAFNLVLAVIGFFLSGLLLHGARLSLPKPVAPQEPANHYANDLNLSAGKSAELMLGAATRSAVQMGHTFESMLRRSLDIFSDQHEDLLQDIVALEREINDRFRALKLFLSKVNTKDEKPSVKRRYSSLLDFITGIEAGGDILSKSLVALAKTKAKESVNFSPEGWREITALHEQLTENLQLALNALVTHKSRQAETLLQAKRDFKEQERVSFQNHFRRLQRDSKDSIETSDLHLETIFALRQINSRLLAFAYSMDNRTADTPEKAEEAEEAKT